MKTVGENSNSFEQKEQGCDQKDDEIVKVK